MINAKDSQNTFYILDKKTDVPIVFIHGVGLSHKIWEPQINVFENTFLAYDILGHGKTPLNKKQINRYCLRKIYLFHNFYQILLKKLILDVNSNLVHLNYIYYI